MLVQLDPDRFIREVMEAIKTMPSEMRIHQLKRVHGRARAHTHTHAHPNTLIQKIP